MAIRWYYDAARRYVALVWNWLRPKPPKWDGIPGTAALLPVDASQYLSAWARVAATADGRIIIQMFQHSLSELMLERCPFEDTHKRSEWLLAHDTRKKLIIDLLEHATRNVGLVTKRPAGLKPPTMGANQGVTL